MITQEYIAFHGELEVVSAEWSIANGRTATFRICGEAYGRNHPFKQFQQRRAGRVGTRFAASMAMSGSAECLPLMEFMLMSWKDSSSIGQTVGFWLDQESTIHPFSGCAYRKGSEIGSIFAATFVELGDDDKPVRQRSPYAPDPGAADDGLRNPTHVRPDLPVDSSAGPLAEAVPEGGPGTAVTGTAGSAGGRSGLGSDVQNGRPPRSVRKLSSLAHLTSQNSNFVRFLEETRPHIVPRWTPELARRYVKATIQVESMADLDRNQDAATRFENLIQKPYHRWRYQHPG